MLRLIMILVPVVGLVLVATMTPVIPWLSGVIGIGGEALQSVTATVEPPSSVEPAQPA